MEPQCLQTFVQISDLHFGDLDAKGSLVHGRAAQILWTMMPLFAGLAGHEQQALKDLVDLQGKLPPDAFWLLTGDLTSLGRISQLRLAEDFVCGEIPATPPDLPVGLHTGNWLRKALQTHVASENNQAIPGNHDHWPGRAFYLGRPRKLVRDWAGKFPVRQNTMTLARSKDIYGVPVKLRFLTLNSDASVWSFGLERILARGSFQSQLRTLKSLLQDHVPQDPNEVRVLLVHHSLVYRALSDPRLQSARNASSAARLWDRLLRRLGMLEINKATRWQLHRVLGQFNIPVLLTGHTHLQSVQLGWAFSPERGSPMQLLEACCGTTTQLNDVPTKWITPFQHLRSRKLDANSLLVHSLMAKDKGIYWKTESWVRAPGEGFAPSAKNGQGKPYSSELLVWSPR